MSQPPLIISALDAQRLRNMLDSGAHDHMPGVDALSDEIDRATIVEPQQVPPDVVTMNSTVRFINDSTGQEFQLKLVYPEDVATRLAGEPTKLAQDEAPVQVVSVLAPVGSATCVRVHNGKPVITDGPFAETKEQLGGYYLLDCANLDEALAWAGRCPAASLGTIEVRPVTA